MTDIDDDRDNRISDTVIDLFDNYVYLGHKLKLSLVGYVGRLAVQYI